MIKAFVIRGAKIMKKLFLMLCFSLVMISSNVDAYSFYSNIKQSHITVDSWSIVVGEDFIYAPVIKVEENGFENRKYTMEIEWGKETKESYDYIYKAKKTRLGRSTSGKEYFDINYKSKEKELYPKFVKINGVLVDKNEIERDIRFYKDVLVELTGQLPNRNNYNVTKYGAKEILFDYEKKIPEYDGYGNLKYYNITYVKYEVYPIFSKVNKKIMVSKYSSYGSRYYPALNEFFDGYEKSYFFTYEFAKNSSGVWRQKMISGNLDSWYDADKDIVDKLDDLKLKLGI